jgi:hypothetical protein
MYPAAVHVKANLAMVTDGVRGEEIAVQKRSRRRGGVALGSTQRRDASCARAAGDVDCGAGAGLDAKGGAVVPKYFVERVAKGAVHAGWRRSLQADHELARSSCRRGYSCTRSVTTWTATPANAAGRRGHGALFRCELVSAEVLVVASAAFGDGGG